ncbi:hypothetical protein [Deinococcus terrestris]|uniref:hypothetical protein n=1 Tax=Deinococcus terrestris TaxID=2651870 RepID=UPI001D137CAC|nr:hypothetical protein [Deinococcus terrestris]
MDLLYHRTVTSGLQATLHLARASPIVAVIQAPIAKAEAIAQRQIDRYPTITASHTLRSSLRRAKYPVVQMVILPPTGEHITLVLMSNAEPSGSREDWFNGLDPAAPFTWRNYELTRQEGQRLTWRLNNQARAYYRKHIARAVTGRGGRQLHANKAGKITGKVVARRQHPPLVARTQLLRLGDHLSHYPGFSGVRKDVFDLYVYSQRVWRSTHPDEPPPAWPYMPYLRYCAPKRARLSDLQEMQHDEN